MPPARNSGGRCGIGNGAGAVSRQPEGGAPLSPLALPRANQIVVFPAAARSKVS